MKELLEKTYRLFCVFISLVFEHSSEHKTIVLLAAIDVVGYQLRHEDGFSKMLSTTMCTMGPKSSLCRSS